MAQFKITYFDFPGGRGEDCRLALHIGDADFEDDRLPGPTWAERKSGTPFGALPVLEVEGKGTLAQSNAILAYLGRQLDLHPTDAWDAARHEAIMASVEELREKVAATTQVKDPAEKQRIREELASGWMQTWGANVERQIGDGPYVAGDRLHVVDLKIFVALKWFLSGGVDHIAPDVFAAFPKLVRVYDAVKDHPKVVDWYARGG